MTEKFDPGLFLWETQQSRKTMMILTVMLGALSAFAGYAAVVILMNAGDYAGLVITVAVAVVLMFVWSFFEYRSSRRLELKLAAEIRAMKERQAERDA